MIYSDYVESLADEPAELRELYLLVGDKVSVAALDRKTMGQSRQIQTDR